jgi:DNA-binding CsgD family transcriptional regulator
MVLIQADKWEKIFNVILANSLLSLFVTVPCYVYKSKNLGKKCYLLIPIIFLIAALLYNYLILIGYAGLAFSTMFIFYVILFVPVLLKKVDNDKRNDNDKKMDKAGIITFCIVLFFSFMTFPLYKFFSKAAYLLPVYFGLFYIVYQVPGLLYCKNRLYREYKSFNLSKLTKREKEVAMEICNGLKYEEIANKLFVSLSAVKKHAYNIYRKLGIKNNRELILLVNEEKERMPQK